MTTIHNNNSRQNWSNLLVLSAAVHLYWNDDKGSFDKNRRRIKQWRWCYSDLVRSHDLWGVGHAVSLLAFIQHRFDLLSTARGVFNIDRDLSLTRAVRVHREHGRTHHPVTCRLDTWQQREQIMNIWYVKTNSEKKSSRQTLFNSQDLTQMFHKSHFILLLL